MSSPGVSPQPQQPHTDTFSVEQQHELEKQLKAEGISIDPKDLKNLNTLRAALSKLPGGEQKFVKLMRAISTMKEFKPAGREEFKPAGKIEKHDQGLPAVPKLTPKAFKVIEHVMIKELGQKEGKAKFEQFKKLYLQKEKESLPLSQDRKVEVASQRDNQIEVMATVVGSKAKAEQVLMMASKRIDPSEGLGGISSAGAETE